MTKRLIIARSEFMPVTVVRLDEKVKAVITGPFKGRYGIDWRDGKPMEWSHLDLEGAVMAVRLELRK